MANQTISPGQQLLPAPKSVRKKSRADPFNTFNTLFMIGLVVVTLYPFLNTIVVSLNAGMIRSGAESISGRGNLPGRTTRRYLLRERYMTRSGFPWHERCFQRC